MAGPSNALLAAIAQGAQPRMADAAARGYQQGANMLAFQQQQQDRNALAKIAQAYAAGGPQAARDAAGQLGQYDATIAADKTLYGRGRDDVLDQRDARNFKYRQGRDAVGDQFRNRDFSFRQERANVGDQQWQQTFDASRFDAEFGRGLQERKLRAAEAKLQAEKSNPAANFEGENKLRKDFQSVTKDFRDVRDAYSRIDASAKNASPAGDLALIFNYMKMLDPGSVVRESEFATAAASGSYGERIKALVGNITSGQRLSPAMRDDFVSRADALYKKRQGQYAKTEQEFRTLAQRYRFDPTNVVLDFNSDAAASNPAENEKVMDYQDFFRDD